MVTGYGSNTFGSAYDPSVGPVLTLLELVLISLKIHEPPGIRDPFFRPVNVVYFRYGTDRLNLCKALEWRGFSPIARDTEKA